MANTGGEYRGFVFSLVFILVFTALVAAIPTGYQGLGETPSNLTAVDPNIISGFSESINFTSEGFDIYPTFGIYSYDLGDDSFQMLNYSTYINLMKKIYFLDIFWFGAVVDCEFYFEGASRGTDLLLSAIQSDAVDGVVRYSVEADSISVGSVIIYWNSTLYPNFTNAWASGEVDIIHGIGFAESATADVGQLIVGLLFLQLPDVPVLVNILLAAPLWASIVYLLWYIIKEMIPFV